MDHSTKIISEQQLESSSSRVKALLRECETSDVSVAHLKALSFTIDEILTAADTHHITVKQRVLACNVLCQTIEQCLASRQQSIQQILCNLRVARRLTVLYVGRYDHVKSKAMKQVLNTLLRLLRCLDSFQTYPRPSIVALEMFFEIISIENDHLQAKPALHALVFMLNKKTFSYSGLIWLFNQWRASRKLGTPFASQSDGLLSMLRTILDWMKFSDVAATAGQFLTTLLSRQVVRIDEEFNSRNSDTSQLPIWAEPLLESIRDDPGALLAFKAYAFPGLFQLDLLGYWAFLMSLGIKTYLNPSMKESVDAKVLLIPEETREEILFSALQIGKACSLVKVVPSRDHDAIFLAQDFVAISDASVGKLMTHQSSVARITGLTLLVTSQQLTAPLTKRSLAILKRNFPDLFTDTDANFRGEVLGLVQSLVDRIRAVTFNLTAKINRPQNPKKHRIMKAAEDENKYSSPADIERSLHAHKHFLGWFIDFLNAELHACASYQRHISALKSLKMLLRSGIDSTIPTGIFSKQARGDISWPFHISVIDNSSRRQLTDLLLDAFDDVRQASLSILQIHSASVHPGFKDTLGVMTAVEYQKFLVQLRQTRSRGEDLMMQTGRVDHADGVARICDLTCYVSSRSQVQSSNDSVATVFRDSGSSTYEFVEVLTKDTENAINLARRHLYTAVSKAPIHGLFTSLRYSVAYLAKGDGSEELEKCRAQLINRMLKCVVGIWECVQHLLCKDAPEGHMPEDVDVESDMTTKDIYSYSWRALKDSSLLLREIVSADVDELLRPIDTAHATYRLFGDLCFRQLAELRHRGAFSTVSQTFFVVCQHCVRHSDHSVRSFVEQWYQETKLLIQSRGSATTRRSAGIPALVVSVLSAEPHGDLFDKAVNELQALALNSIDNAHPENLPQVHALNSLKAIFTTTRLASQSERYITSSIKVAGHCLGSPIWAIRNCGLMLFRGLFDRLLGSDQKLISSAKQTGHIVPLRWGTYPGLLDLLVDMLQKGHDTAFSDATASTRTDSGLQAETIFPAIDIFRRATPPEEKLEQVRSLVRDALSSSNWHVRVIASRAHSAIAEHTWLSKTGVSRISKENDLHGHLLTMRHQIREFLAQNDRNSCFYAQRALIQLFEPLKNGKHSPPTWSSFADSLVELGEFHIRRIPVLSVPNAPYGGYEVETSQYVNLVNGFEEATRMMLGERPSALLERSLRLAILMSDIISDNEETRLAALNELMHREQNETTPHHIRTTDCKNTIFNLTEADTDITLWVFERIESLIDDVELSFTRVLVRALLGVLNAIEGWQSIQSAAFGLLATCLSYIGIPQNGWEVSIAQQLSALRVDEVFWNSSTPSEMENSLKLWGFSLHAKVCVQERWNADLNWELSSLFKVCRIALDENNEYPLRFAAVTSLNGLSLIFSSQSTIPADHLVSLLLTIYRGCVDDDEDVREVAARAAVNVLSVMWPSKRRLTLLSPTAACRMICQQLVENSAKSTFALDGVLENFFGQKLSALGTFDLCLEKALHRDTSLFATEKQNLYIDPVKEAYMWSQVLKLSNLRTIPTSTIHLLSDWTIPGLETLKAKIETEIDGPLGWVSKPEVFALGMRVIYAAEILLYWRMASKRVPVRGSAIRRLLAQLSEAGEPTGLHQTWRRNIDRVLERSVISRLQRVHSVLAVLM